MALPANVSEGATIEPDWGNDVADTVSDHEDRLLVVEGLTTSHTSTLSNHSGRLTALETSEARQGIWWVRGSSQSIGATTTSVVTNTATTEATSGFSVSSGVVTIPTGRSGVYVVFVKISTSGTFSGAWITVDNTFDVSLNGGASDRGGAGHWTGTASLRLNAGQNVRIYVRNPLASAQNVTGAQVHLWRVSA